MTRFSIIFTIVCFSVGMISCSGNKNKENHEISTLYEIDYSHDNSSNVISSIIDTLEFIPLLGSIENPISHVDELQVNYNGIFILDKRRNKIHAYDSEGTHSFTLQSMGHANHEYLEIACFAVRDSSIFVVDNYGQKINEYSNQNGRFIESYPVSLVIGAIRPLKNGNFLLAELPMQGVNQLTDADGHRLYISDNSFNIKSSAYPYQNERDKVGLGSYLSSNDSVIIYNSTGFNGFTQISATDGSIMGNVNLNTPKPFNHSEIADMDLAEAMDYVEKHKWQFLTTTPLAVGRYIYLSVKDNEVAEPCIYDADSKKLYFNSEKSMFNNLIAPDDAYQDSFYTVYNFGEDFLNNQLKMGFNTPPLAADSIIRNDGAVLLRYRMKMN